MNLTHLLRLLVIFHLSLENITTMKVRDLSVLFTDVSQPYRTVADTYEVLNKY